MDKILHFGCFTFHMLQEHGSSCGTSVVQWPRPLFKGDNKEGDFHPLIKEFGAMPGRG